MPEVNNVDHIKPLTNLGGELSEKKGGRHPFSLIRKKLKLSKSTYRENAVEAPAKQPFPNIGISSSPGPRNPSETPSNEQIVQQSFTKYLFVNGGEFSRDTPKFQEAFGRIQQMENAKTPKKWTAARKALKKNFYEVSESILDKQDPNFKPKFEILKYESKGLAHQFKGKYYADTGRQDASERHRIIAEEYFNKATELYKLFNERFGSAELPVSLKSQSSHHEPTLGQDTPAKEILISGPNSEEQLGARNAPGRDGPLGNIAPLFVNNLEGEGDLVACQTEKEKIESAEFSGVKPSDTSNLSALRKSIIKIITGEKSEKQSLDNYIKCLITAIVPKFFPETKRFYSAFDQWDYAEKDGRPRDDKSWKDFIYYHIKGQAEFPSERNDPNYGEKRQLAWAVAGGLEWMRKSRKSPDSHAKEKFKNEALNKFAEAERILKIIDFFEIKSQLDLPNQSLTRIRHTEKMIDDTQIFSPPAEKSEEQDCLYLEKVKGKIAESKGEVISTLENVNQPFSENMNSLQFVLAAYSEEETVSKKLVIDFFLKEETGSFREGISRKRGHRELRRLEKSIYSVWEEILDIDKKLLPLEVAIDKIDGNIKFLLEDICQNFVNRNSEAFQLCKKEIKEFQEWILKRATGEKCNIIPKEFENLKNKLNAKSCIFNDLKDVYRNKVKEMYLNIYINPSVSDKRFSVETGKSQKDFRRKVEVSVKKLKNEIREIKSDGSVLTHRLREDSRQLISAEAGKLIGVLRSDEKKLQEIFWNKSSESKWQAVSKFIQNVILDIEDGVRWMWKNVITGAKNIVNAIRSSGLRGEKIAKTG